MRLIVLLMIADCISIGTPQNGILPWYPESSN